MNKKNTHHRDKFDSTYWHLMLLYSAFGKSLSTYKRCYSIERTVVSKIGINQLHAALQPLFNN
jgi:hypothetical protein